MNVMLVIVMVTSVVIAVFINVVDTLMDGGEIFAECVQGDECKIDFLKLSALIFLKDTS